MRNTAVVFDSAGTLLQMYRAAKDLKDGVVYRDIVTTDLAISDPNYGIVILHISPDQLLATDCSSHIHTFIEENDITINIGCSSVPLSVDEAHMIIRSDTTAMVSDLQEVLMTVCEYCNNRNYMGVGVMTDKEHNCIAYTLSTGGTLFPEVPDVISQLKGMDVDIYIASGDKQEDVDIIAKSIGVEAGRRFGLSTPQRKGEIIRALKGRYEKVVMVGDAVNDILAFREADLAVLTIQQRNVRPGKLNDESDVVIDHISQVVPLVRDIL